MNRHTFHKRIKTHPILIKTTRQSCIIILLSFGLAYIIPPSQAAKEKGDIIQELEIFNQIKKIALQRDEILHQQEKNYSKSRDQLFHKAMNAYETAQDIEEKLKYAKELNVMLQEQDKFFKDKGYKDITQDTSFHKLENSFIKTGNATYK